MRRIQPYFILIGVAVLFLIAGAAVYGFRSLTPYLKHGAPIEPQTDGKNGDFFELWFTGSNLFDLSVDRYVTGILFGTDAKKVSLLDRERRLRWEKSFSENPLQTKISDSGKYLAVGTEGGELFFMSTDQQFWWEQDLDGPIYLLAPSWAEIPLFLLATAAATVASQALITAAFSVTKQAIQLGILPRMQVRHTSVKDTGQIYVPFVNWGLFVFIVLAVGLFKSSSNLASAYGIAVTLDMTITTVMTFFVVRYGWKYPLWLTVLSTGFFFVIDVTFFASNMLKLIAGGWFLLPLCGAGVMVLTSHTSSRARVAAAAISGLVFVEAVLLAVETPADGPLHPLARLSEPQPLLRDVRHDALRGHDGGFGRTA